LRTAPADYNGAMSEATSGASPRRHHRDWDAYAAVIASLVGLLALSVSGYTAYLQRQQVRAQVWPRLELSRANRQTLIVTNSGVGPARVKSMQVLLDGRPQRTWADLLRALGHEPAYGGSTISGRVLAAGQSLDVYSTDGSEAGRGLFADVFYKHESRIIFNICYCSVLDDCWLAQAGGAISNDELEVQVDECKLPKEQRFAQ
jgi:hypothetical protein